MKVKVAVALVLLFSLCILLLYLKTDLVRSRRTAPTDSSKRNGSLRASNQALAASSPVKVRPDEDLPIDPAAVRVATGFRGHDIEKVYASLLDAEGKRYKDQFETTPQYRERIQRLAAAPILGQLNRTSIYAFAVKTIVEGYDADGESLTVKVSIQTDMLPASAFHNGYMAIYSRGSNITKSSYVGTNAFGVTVPVEVIANQYYYIAFRSSVGLEIQGNGVWRDYLFRLHMPISEARDAKDKLAAVAVCRLVPPFTDSYTGEQKPTISNPKQETSYYKYISVDLLDVWLYDITTGKILQKLRNPQFSAALEP